jgi:phage terminase large subunit-like protein
MEFFRVGEYYRERCFMAANRIGKTEGAGGYETALHLTGLYPEWWEGARFDGAIRAWAAGKTNETTRDIVQAKLFGKVKGSGAKKRVMGTGLIPGDMIGDINWKQGVQDLIDTVEIKHENGGESLLALKSYQQGRGAFEGTEQEVVWLDEEPPMDIYSECLIRIMTTEGILYMTFTPLDGMTDTVLQFIPEGMQLK